ncbi:MAG: hypothetical protein Q9209_000823 [Squamulea sp. 1 TL-2023]
MSSLAVSLATCTSGFSILLIIAYQFRVRHVKCDEEKPECHKCKSTGRKCDGYVYKKAVFPPLPLPPKADKAMVKTARSNLTPLPTSLGGWTGTLEEFRGFEYFRVQTSQDLAYSLNASLQELVLQNSHRHQAIKHAAIALGSLGETIRINSSSTSLDTLPPAFMKHEFARSQYHIAIQILQKNLQRAEKDTVEIALISCFLFAVFEFLQGNDQSSMSHLRSGLAILRTQYFPHVDRKAVVQDITKQLSPMQAEIARIFHILDTQATMWLGLRTFQDKTYVPLDGGRASTYNTPEYFDSLDDACRDLINLITRVYNFRRYASQHDFAPSTTHIPASIYDDKNALLDELDIHRRRLSRFLARQIDAQTPEDPHRVIILRINRKVTTMMLATYLEPHEERFYARCMSHFWQIISLATFILRQTPEMPRRVVQTVHRNNKAENMPYGRYMFSFFAGLIQPLYFTAIKCREKVTAQKAVDLLELEPWREGAWDSTAMAKIARRKMEELEKSGWYGLNYHRTAVEDTGKERGKIPELSIDWPLATDPFITYPM